MRSLYRMLAYPTRTLWHATKAGISILLIGYLFVQVSNDNQFGALVRTRKSWPLLAVAVTLGVAAISMTILRWHMLMRTLGVTVSVHQSLRAGLLGYVANLLPLGLVAGDTLKSAMVIRRNHARKTEVVASVLLDRSLGLLSLLFLAGVAVAFVPPGTLLTSDLVDGNPILRLGSLVQMLAMLGGVGFIVAMMPGFTRLPLWDMCGHVPAVGTVIGKMVAAMRAYRRRIDVILLGLSISLASHIVYVSAIVLTTYAIGIPSTELPSVSSMLVIVPLSLIADSLPIGVYEVSITILFRAASPAEAPPHVGLLVALMHRVIQVTIGGMGLAYWLWGRAEVRQVISESDEGQ